MRTPSSAFSLSFVTSAKAAGMDPGHSECWLFSWKGKGKERQRVKSTSEVFSKNMEECLGHACLFHQFLI